MLKGADGWITNAELAERAEVADRTARLHARRFVNLRLLEERRVLPEPHFRWLLDADDRNPNYLRRLDEAVAIFAGVAKSATP